MFNNFMKKSLMNYIPMDYFDPYFGIYYSTDMGLD